MAAWDNADPDALAALMHDDIRITMPPYPFWFEGREDAVGSLIPNLTPEYRGHWRFLPTTINRQPTLAAYLLPPHMTSYQLFALDIFRIEDRRIAEITAFETTDHKLYGLPATV